MEYKLAKELEAAGFPQGGNGTWVYPLDALTTRPSDRIYAPTLEELIEACGGRLAGLSYDRDFKQWHTQVHMPDGLIAESVDISLDPVQAVARLWLALNKPNTTSEASS